MSEKMYLLCCVLVQIQRETLEKKQLLKECRIFSTVEYPIDYIEVFTPKSFFSFQQFHASHQHETGILQVITLRASRLDSSLHDRKYIQSAKFAWSILHSELNKAHVLPPIEGNDNGRTTNTQTHREVGSYADPSEYVFKFHHLETRRKCEIHSNFAIKVTKQTD